MKIIYVYDALCGWCYGFAPVFRAFYDKYKSKMDFEVISGGMITGSRIGPIGEVAGYISQAYKDVEQRTGVKFGKGFLDGTMKEGTAIFTSVPPAEALSVVKDMDESLAVYFAEAIQKAIYYDGMEPSDEKGYVQIATSLGLDKTKFLEAYNGGTFQLSAEDDFRKTQQLGVSGFPTVFFQRDSHLMPIARGYSDLETMEKRMESALV